MQSESTQIHLLHKSVSCSFKAILDCYLRENYLENTSLADIHPSDPHNFKPLSSVYLGVKVGMELSRQNAIPSQEIDQFRQRCLSFLIEAAVQIMKRFPFHEACTKI